jgi:hypothetical protein
MDDDIVGKAIEAAKYADAIMARTAAGDDLPDPESAAGLNHPAYQEPRPDDTLRIPPDSPHDEWRPRHGDLDHLQWHPPYGETHVKYHIYPIRGGGSGSFSGKPKFYRANSHGIYQGMQTVDDPTGNRPSIEMPKYSNEDEPERVLNENGSHPLNFRSLNEAQSAAEKHYAENYGTPPSHDYDIDTIMGQPGTQPGARGLGDDEDYSRIFDAVRRALKKAGAALRKVGFDWKQTPEHELDWSDAKDQWWANLENGHQLGVWGNPGEGYHSALDLPFDPENPDEPMGEDNDFRWPVRDNNGNGRMTKFPTREHAQRGAEQEYQKLFPIGTSTGTHDSGVDYDKMINKHDDLNDDFGHIFGMHARYAAAISSVSDAVRERIAAELSPPCPDCGQVAGWDEHMVSPRVRVCRNCDWPMLDYGVKNLLDETLKNHDRAVAELPETDHPNLGKHGARNPKPYSVIWEDHKLGPMSSPPFSSPDEATAWAESNVSPETGRETKHGGGVIPNHPSIKGDRDGMVEGKYYIEGHYAPQGHYATTVSDTRPEAW